MKRIWMLSLLLFGCGPQQLPDVGQTGRGMFAEVQSFGSNPGGLKMFKYVPASVMPNAPVMFALHACSQTATDYQNAGWNDIADAMGFYVVYPEQQTNNNPLRCFNWAGEYGDPLNLTRGEGENESIKQMVDKMIADHSIDPTRVYLSGHSGGGAQVALMLATWPDVFAGGAMIAGIPYDCTTTFTEVSTCLNPGIDRSQSEWGMRARNGFPGYQGPWPKVSIWQGTADSTVRPLNANELLEQWSDVHGIDMTADVSGQVDGHTRDQFQDAAGVTQIESYTLSGMGHGTPVVPGMGCGGNGAYFLDVGICAAQRIAEFFEMDGMVQPGDRTPPTVSITAPADGATVTGLVNIQASASDDVGVTEVRISINGARVQTLSAAPYAYAWNSAVEANGSYLLEVAAEDAAGNIGTDARTVTVMGGIDDTTPPTVDVTSPTTGASVTSPFEITVTASDDFGVARVEILVDGTVAAEVTAPPYVASVSASEGMHQISAIAYDAAGNSQTDDDTTVSVAAGDTQPPTVSFVSPGDGDTLSGIVRINVAASDENGLHSVLLFLDGELIGSDYRGPDYEFLWDTGTYAEGPYTLTTRAFDPAGNVAVAEIDIIVEAGMSVDTSTTGTERILAGKRYWGCSAAPPESAGLILLLGAVLLLRRRRS